MKENKYFLNTALAAVVGLAVLIAVVVRAFAPQVIIPRLGVPNMVLLSLLALLLDHYIAPKAKRCWVCIPVFSLVTFGLLPLAAAFVTLPEALKLAVLGGVVFTVTTALYTAIRERLSSGPASRISPFLTALGLYLASQCFMGL